MMQRLNPNHCKSHEAIHNPKNNKSQTIESYFKDSTKHDLQ
ncbi:hypothetical protein [uncultured Helicobacter sp.]|nr:hypothetical protein [uncultured Helicobacter sp.]